MHEGELRTHQLSVLKATSTRFLLPRYGGSLPEQKSTFPHHQEALPSVDRTVIIWDIM